MAPTSPVSLSGLFKKLGFSSDDPTGHVQLGSLEDLQVRPTRHACPGKAGTLLLVRSVSTVKLTIL